MAIRVILNIFSGLPNPEWTISGKELGKHLADLRSLETEDVGNRSPGVYGRPGYSGFTIFSDEEEELSGLIEEFLGPYPRTRVLESDAGVLDFEGLLSAGSQEESKALNLFDKTRFLEKALLDDLARQIQRQKLAVDTGMASPKFDKWILRLLDDIFPKLSAELSAGFTKADMIHLVTLYEYVWDNPIADKWVKTFDVRRRNNCYNFAMDQITPKFAEPGDGCGAPPQSTWAEKAVCDGLKPLSSHREPDPVRNTADGHNLALVIHKNGKDFHWFRQLPDGKWCHKLGGRRPTDRWRPDGASTLVSIEDPSTATYEKFSTFGGFFYCPLGATAQIQP
ncbi:MAG: hypothetical protein ABJZ55_01155 [Fuerstiella sp.]